MRDYEALLKQKADMLDVKIIQHDIQLVDNWLDAYWIGRFVYEQASGEADKLIIEAYEKAFTSGLNIRTNRELFLTVTQQLARIYFQYRKYDEAINKLMVLDANVDDLPDWVYLYYASAQIHTENVLYWAEVPEFLFKRIDRIDESNQESVRRRNALYLEFLNRVSEIAKIKDTSAVDTAAILTKASELGLADSRECVNFKTALGVVTELPGLPINPETEVLQEGNSESVYEQIVAELNKRLSELQIIIDRQSLTIEQDKKAAEEYQKQIDTLQSNYQLLERESIRRSEELKIAKEHEYALQARCGMLESQLSGSEAIRKQLEEDASVIGELRIDVEDLKTALTVSKRNNEKYQAEISQKQEVIEELTEELNRNRETVQELHSTIESQRMQIEIAEAAVRNAEASAKPAEVKRTIESPEQESSSSKQKSTVDQPTLLDILKVENFLPRRQKILIIGGSETKENHLRGKLKNTGFNFAKDQLEFELDYANVKDYASRIKPWSGKYAGIIVGPCPHKAKDIDGYSSFIEKIKYEEGYPHVEEARDKSGALKISNASIVDTMMKMAVYLYSIA